MKYFVPPIETTDGAKSSSSSLLTNIDKTDGCIMAIKVMEAVPIPGVLEKESIARPQKKLHSNEA